MNITIHTHGSTWKNARNRYVIGIGGVALAITVAIAGISALPSSSGSRPASVTPQVQSRPSTLFQTEADAALALQGEVAVSPQFANVTDAIDAALALGFSRPVSPTVESPDAYLGLGQPGEGSASVIPEFANMTDAIEALYYLEVQQVSVAPTLAQPVAPTVDSPDAYLGLGQPAERSALLSPELANVAAGEAMAYGVFDAQPVVTSFGPEDALGLGQPGERSFIPQLFSNYVDAWEASIRQ